VTVTSNIHVGLTGWVGPFSYVVGNRVVNAGNAYQCITAGTSASGAGPTTTSANITDGTAHWKWLSAVDFTTLASAQASLPATFTQPIIWQIWNSAGTISIPGSTTPYLTLSGHTTTNTNNLTITCAPGESFRDTLAGGHTALAFNASAGVSITTPTATPGFQLGWFDITDKFVVIDGLQFRDPNATSNCTLLSSEAGSSGLTLRNCLFDGTAQAGPLPIISLADTALITNCVIIDRQPPTTASVAIKSNNICSIINCTVYAGTAATNTVLLLSDSPTVGGSHIRNTASFGYSTGLGFTGGSGVAGNVVVDHCVSTSATIGSGSTDGGGNLLSQSAATNLIAPGTDLRLTLGASCINAGVTDLTNIPLGTDIVGISRPQGSAWDIGVYEFQPMAMRGTSMARGRSTISTGNTARGTGRAFGRGILVASLGVLGSIGKAVSKGFATGTFAQISAPTDPWDVIFSSEFGPLTPPALFIGLGNAQGRGRSLISGVQALTARGSASGFGRTPSTPLSTALVVKSSGRANGRSALTAILPAVAGGLAKGVGRSAVTAVLAVAGRAQAVGIGQNNLARSGVFSAKGTAIGRGASTIIVPAVLTGRSIAVGIGRGLPLYLVGGLSGGSVPRGRSATSGRAGLQAAALLQVIGIAAGKGNATFGSNVVILPGSGLSTAAARAQGLNQTSALLARSNTAGSGRLIQGALQSLSAAGLGAKAMARAVAIYNGFLPSRGRSFAKGRLANPTQTAALSASGMAQGDGIASSRYQALLATTSRGVAAGRGSATNRQLLSATGLAVGDGTLGGNGIQRLVTTRGGGASSAKARLSSLTALAAMGRVISQGASSLLMVKPLALFGLSFASGQSSIVGVTWLRATSLIQATGSIQGAFTVALSGNGQASGTAAGRATQAAKLIGTGLAEARGGLGLSTGRVGFSAVGRSVSAGRCGSLVFAPIALVASGQARTAGSSSQSVTTALRGTTLGLSSGRCASIQSALLMGSGRAHGAGKLAAALAVGLQARASGRGRGRLYSLSAISASGMAQSYGSGLVAGYYNVTPDVVGPRLSSLGAMPAFDPMDLGDIDFVSWDWSARASVTGDPIITASVTVSPSGLPVGIPVVVGDIVQVRIGSSSVIETFSLRCSVTLRSGRVLHWSAPVSVEDF
jgi:hypothetical protein